MQGLAVGDAEHLDAVLSEEGVAKSITSLATVMGRSVDFDGELGGHAEEVREVGANRKLAAEQETVELTAAQALPERPFGGRGVVTVATGQDGSAMKGALHTPFVDTKVRQLRRDRQGREQTYCSGLCEASIPSRARCFA
jgi:hypothetical protein